MTDVIKILKSANGVDDYRVTSTERESYELFFVHEKLETVRSTDTVATDVTVYVNHDGKKGDSSFSVFESMTEEEVSAKVASAAQRAKLVFNEPYEIPEGGHSETEIASNFTDYTMPELAKKVAEAVFAADTLEFGSLNATEVFIYKDTVSVKNSRGVDKTQVKHHAMVETIPTWTENGESVELYENYTFTEYDAEAITAEIEKKLREVRDRQLAKKPATPLTCNVLLGTKELSRMFFGMVNSLNFSEVYGHSNLYKVGDSLQSGDGDKLTLTLKGALKGSTRSAAFDEDGVDLGEKTVIENGVVTAYHGSSRYAYYLGEEATGSLRCTELKAGTLTEEEIKSEPYVECVSMSGLQVDLYNDYIGGEIRLAYHYDGKEVTPATAISMSGKLSEVLGSLRLSEKVVSTDGYTGPEKAMLKGMTIL